MEEYKSISKLKEYFSSKTEEELKKDWEEIQALNLGGPSVDDFLKSINKLNALKTKIEDLNKSIEVEVDKTVKDIISVLCDKKVEKGINILIKSKILELIGSIFNEKEWLKLQNHYDSTKGIEVTDLNPREILHLFWNHCSDICPLEASEQEKQELLFKSWIESYIFTL